MTSAVGSFAAIQRMVAGMSGHDVEVVHSPRTDGSLSGAVFSRAPQYRYLLWRAWDASRPLWTFGMLNPSTADQDVLDPTITRCQKRAREGGAGGFVVWNLFAYRATDPRQMKIRTDPVGPENDNAILYAVRDSALNIAAWGVDGGHMGRDMQVRRLLAMTQVPLKALGFTKDGFPRHPLYMPDAIEPMSWEYAA